MAVAKKENFTAEEVELAELAKAMGHPARIAILKVLAERKSCICGEIVEVLPLAQATVSQHLKALKKAGIVTGVVDGPRSCYCLDTAVLTKAKQAFEALFADIFNKNCC